MKRSSRNLLFFILFLCLASSGNSLGKETIENYQVLFSPEDRLADALIQLIEKEKKSIRAAVYCFTHFGIAKALIDAHRRGVDVEVIIDPYSIKVRSPVKKMDEAQLPLFVWHPSIPEIQTKKGKKTKKFPALMHDKFCVFGNHLVWTGSFNFTFEAAHSHCENVVVLENSQIAKRYLEEFQHLKKEGCQSFKEYIDPNKFLQTGSIYTISPERPPKANRFKSSQVK